MRSDSALPPAGSPGPSETPEAAAGAATRTGRGALGMSLGAIGGLLAALAAMLILFSLLSDTFFTVPTFTTIANEIPDLLVMAVGMTFVLMIGGIDLSVGSVLALSASMLSIAMTRFGWGLAPAALLGVLAATATGALTGTVTVRWGIPSFIVSLGVLEMARGLAYNLTDSRTVYLGSTVDWLATPIALGIAPAFLIAIAITVIGQVVLVRTVFGRYLVAIGTNEEAVRLAGVNPHPYKIAVFALMGWLSGLAALFQVARLEAADPNAGGGMELQVIAAVVIGGTSLMGGRGSVARTLFGVLIISVLEAGLAQIGASEPTKRIITGAVIVAAVVMDTYRTRTNRVITRQ
ncbi:ABC transporter permease [Ralstonia pseudosolanacearum]|uniref:ABC transporter permease n=1 Tax=Ralstonia pseudosolanacearum TaxID=1310165 RepID=UPI0018685CE5|nr:ABC transporter permease [Ralstonia pseudosolanacearum]QOK92320.1 ABC transporter permease [Ralstonia pseudosolanacearum]